MLQGPSGVSTNKPSGLVDENSYTYRANIKMFRIGGGNLSGRYYRRIATY